MSWNLRLIFWPFFDHRIDRPYGWPFTMATPPAGHSTSATTPSSKFETHGSTVGVGAGAGCSAVSTTSLIYKPCFTKYWSPKEHGMACSPTWWHGGNKDGMLKPLRDPETCYFKGAFTGTGLLLHSCLKRTNWLVSSCQFAGFDLSSRLEDFWILQRSTHFWHISLPRLAPIWVTHGAPKLLGTSELSS